VVESSARVPEPVLSRRGQTTGLLAGALTLLAGGVAVFQTDNEVGSAALVTAGVAIAGLAQFANRIQAFEAAGVRLEMIREAKDAQEEADKARASGEIDRAEQLERRAQSLLEAASNVGSRYEQLRATQPSGWDRTSRMESVLREARSIDTNGLTPSHVETIFDAGGEGNRVFALAVIEGSPDLGSANVLVDGILHSRSPFEQYHALKATESAIDYLSSEDRAEVRSAVESALEGPLGDKSSDRRTLARRILNRLTQADGD
jgi:hypothetical protein